MKKVINGKVFDTSTAKLIAQNDNGYASGDFHYQSESLYKTRNGRYFIYGEGGACSSYAKSAGHTSWGSSDIMAMDEDEAYSWLEQYNETEAIEKYFLDRIEEA